MVVVMRGCSFGALMLGASVSRRLPLLRDDERAMLAKVLEVAVDSRWAARSARACVSKPGPTDFLGARVAGVFGCGVEVIEP